MKKILSVSILAMLAVAPLTANATDAYNTVTIGDKNNATIGDDSTKVATTAYVKGAYNAMIGNLNTENTRATTAEGNLSNRIGSRDTDGNYIKDSAEKNVVENLGLLDTQVKNNADKIGDTTLASTGALASGNNANLSTAVNALNTALGNVGSASTVGSGKYYIGSSHFSDADGTTTPNDASDDNTVANNLVALDTQVHTNETSIGTLSSLGNTASTNTNLASSKTSLVVAVNELDKDMGKVATLGDTAAANNVSSGATLVGAIGSLDAKLGAVSNTNMGTSAETVVGAIHELDAKLDTLTGDAQTEGSLAKEVARATAAEGTLTNLTTTNQGNLVSAINEVNAKVLTVYSSWNANGSTGTGTEISLTAPTPAQP